MESIDQFDVEEKGPITMGEYPAEIYQDFEQRKEILSSAPHLLEDSSIIAATTTKDQIGIRYEQLALENGDIGRNRLFAQSEKPVDFSSQPLFQAAAIMEAFGPEEKQTCEIEKIDQLIKDELDPTILQQAQTLKENLEKIKQLNQIMVEIKNQFIQLSKG